MPAQKPRSIPGRARDAASPNQEMELHSFRSLFLSHNCSNFRIQVSLQPRGIARDNSVRGNIFCHYAPRADNSVLSDGHIRKNRGAGTDRSALLDDGSLYFPIAFRLELAFPGRCARIGIVDESDSVADEDVVFDGHAFADEGMAGNLAIPPNGCVLLNFDERANLGVFPDFTAVKVDEFGKLHARPKLHVRSNRAEFVHRRTNSPFFRMERSTASSMRTTRRPA